MDFGSDTIVFLLFLKEYDVSRLSIYSRKTLTYHFTTLAWGCLGLIISAVAVKHLNAAQSFISLLFNKPPCVVRHHGNSITRHLGG